MGGRIPASSASAEAVGDGILCGATFAPGIARWMPSVTTQSSGASPASITR
ncbi:hypothetical protein AEGHOMDF_4986 [Methylobacterium soli]|nr:hypothetical protein AEGHOMDF_4986 [Methylobacterium soli]